MRKFYVSIIKYLIYIAFISTTKMKKQNLNNYLSFKFLEVNNNYVIKEIKKKRNGKILILLPHCLQLYDCEFKVTANI